MIREAKFSDRAAIQQITEAIGFEASETAEVLKSFDAAHGARHPSPAIWLVDDDAGVRGMAYIEPERMTEGTYNLLLIAVHPHQQKRGRGTQLIRYIERQIAELGGRLLIIETMGTADFAPVRRLYAQLGFVEEARIRDFYASGYDKVVYWKTLTGKP